MTDWDKANIKEALIVVIGAAVIAASCIGVLVYWSK